MANKIQQELERAKEKTFKLIKGTNLVKLSKENVAIVEAMIQNDSRYRKSGDKNAEPDKKKKYGGSTAYWMTQFKNLTGEKSDDYKTIILNLIKAIDKENSTHLAVGDNLNQINKRICRLYEGGNLINSLKNADICIIEEISKKTTGKEPRRNLSFASKFCHYACFYLFEGKKEQDNYSIYDNVVKNALPLYMKQYGVPARDLDNYKEYKEAIDDIIMESKSEISRNGFDHLLWYYFKGRNLSYFK